MLLRSSSYLNAVSNRLAASSARARFLGMVIGEALSSLVEKPDKQMKFKLEELESSEARWYKSLTQVRDTTGSLDLLKSGTLARITKRKPPSKRTMPARALPQGQSKIIAIEELDEADEE